MGSCPPASFHPLLFLQSSIDSHLKPLLIDASALLLNKRFAAMKTFSILASLALATIAVAQAPALPTCAVSFS